MNEAEIKQEFSVALERLDNDVDLLREMAAVTAADCPEHLQSAERAIDSGNCEVAEKHIHRLKGILSTFDDGSLTRRIQELLEHAQRGKATDVQKGFQTIRNDLNGLIEKVTCLASE